MRGLIDGAPRKKASSFAEAATGVVLSLQLAGELSTAGRVGGQENGWTGFGSG